jgi:hypothetical protein
LPEAHALGGQPPVRASPPGRSPRVSLEEGDRISGQIANGVDDREISVQRTNANIFILKFIFMRFPLLILDFSDKPAKPYE